MIHMLPTVLAATIGLLQPVKARLACHSIGEGHTISQSTCLQHRSDPQAIE